MVFLIKNTQDIEQLIASYIAFTLFHLASSQMGKR